jgi:plasmanylethanolamine desaturase
MDPHNSEIDPITVEANLLANSYTKGWRRLEILAICTFISVCGVLINMIYGLSESLTSPEIWTASILAFMSGWVGADLCSGLVHWGADNWGAPDTPFIGSGFIRPFRHHHLDPKEMCNHDFIELNGNLALVVLPVIIATIMIPLNVSPWLDCYVRGSILSLVLWTCLTQQIHSWVHQDNPPRVVTYLQRAHLILGVDHHNRHHLPPHTSNYCITTGWLNPILDIIQFFPRLEWMIHKLTGATPFHKLVDQQSHQHDQD